MSRIGSILNEELAHQRNGSSFAFVPLRHSQPQVELWPIRSQQPPMRPKEPPNPLSTIFRLHRIFIFLLFIPSRSAILPTMTLMTKHASCRPIRSVWRAITKLQQNYPISSNSAETCSHSAAQQRRPSTWCISSSWSLRTNRYPNENVNVLYQLLYQNGFHTIYTSKVYHQISQDLLSKDDNEPALPSTNTKNSSPNTSTISLH